MMSGQFQVGLYVDLCDITLGIVVTATIFTVSIKFLQEQETS
jgi:hypothetical protein